MAGRFSVEAIFKAVDRVTAPVTRMQNRVGKFTRSMSRGFNTLNRSIKKVSAGLKSAGRNVAIAGALFVGASANVIAAGSDFEQAITNVGAVSLQTRAQIAPLEKLALDLGRTTKFTATQAANAMEIMARAGFKANEILTATPAVLSAAAASGLEIAEVANVVSNVLKGMGLATSEAARVSDVLALASARTNSSIGTLGESMKNVASTARQLNIPLEDVVASIALLQDVGLDASVAGSAFNVMLTKMAAPSTKIQKIMRRLKISFKDVNGNMKPLPAVIKDISKASKAMGGNFDQVAFLAELVGLRGQKAAANLSELFETGKLELLTKELKNAKGAADKMAALRMDTFQGSMLLLGSAIDAVKVKIFGLNEGPLKDAVDSMTKWVGANEDLIATNIGGFLANLIDNFENIIDRTKQIGIGLLVFFGLSAILKTIVLVMTAVNLVMAANPLFLLIVGVLALGAAFATVIQFSDKLLDGLKKMPAIVQILLLPIRTLLEAFTAIKSIGSFLGTKLGGALFDLFGGSPDAANQTDAPQVVSPQERVARSIEEQRTTSTAEVTIRDETGRAEVTRGKLGAGLSLQSSGAF